MFAFSLCFAQKQTIVQVEYFTDPAIPPGNGTQIQFADLGENSVDILWDSLPKLLPGTFFYVRVKSSGFIDINNNTIYGVWSLPVMVKYPTFAVITAAEVELVRSNFEPIKKTISSEDGKFDNPVELLNVILRCEDIEAGDTLRVRLQGKDELWGDWIGFEITEDYLKPEKPTNLIVENLDLSKPMIKIQWQPSNSGVVQYNIERKVANLQWIVIDSVNSGDVSYIDSNVTSGNEYSYRIQAISYKTCLNSDYSNIASITITGVENVSNNSSTFSIFPNPVQDILYINFSNEHSKNISIEIYNELGFSVFTQNIGKEQCFPVCINTNEFSLGTYYLILKTGNEVVSKKFIVIR